MNKKFDIVCEVYCGLEYSSSLKKIWLDAAKYKPANYLDDLPDYVKGNDEFIVYHGGPESISQAKNCMSWSLCRDVAEWFATRSTMLFDQKTHIYKGTIMREKVIAYIGQRHEFEIIQHRNVQNIQEIQPTGNLDEYNSLKGIQPEITKEGLIIQSESRKKAWSEYFKKQMGLA